MSKKHNYKEVISTIEFIVVPMAIGLIIGIVFMTAYMANTLDNMVCGDVCMDSDDFYRMFEKWKEAEIMKTQCIRGMEWLDAEFNLTEIIGLEEMHNFSDKYYDKFYSIREEHDEYFKILEGAYVR